LEEAGAPRGRLLDEERSRADDANPNPVTAIKTMSHLVVFMVRSFLPIQPFSVQGS